jgi:hypothetical protein
MGPQLNLNDIGRNCLLGYRKKIAKFLMMTFTCRSTFLYALHRAVKSKNWPLFLLPLREEGRLESQNIEHNSTG